jgi:ribose transport system permease protein
MTTDHWIDATAVARNAEAEEPGERRRNRPTLGRSQLARFSGAYVLVAFVIAYGFWVPKTFLTTATLQSIIGDQAVTGVVTIGVVFALSAGAFDLSFANNLGLSGVVCADLMLNHHVNPAVAIALTLMIGLLVGAVNAFFVIRIGVSSIVVTLGMSSVLSALNSKLTNGGQFLTGLPRSFTNLASPKPLGVPILAIYLLVAAIVGWYVLEHTPVGRRLQATGAGPDAARLAGVNTGRMTLLAFLICGGMSSLAGVLVTAQVGSATPDIGTGYLLAVFAAAYLGTTQIKPGRFNIGGTVLAIFLLATGVKGLQLGGGEAWITDAFNGTALILAVSLAAIGQRGRPAKPMSRLSRTIRRRSGPPIRTETT